MCLCVAHLPQRPGYYTHEGEFVFAKEMIPEFVVPDLTDFQVCGEITLEMLKKGPKTNFVYYFLL